MCLLDQTSSDDSYCWFFVFWWIESFLLSVVSFSKSSGKTCCIISGHKVGCQKPFMNIPQRDFEMMIWMFYLFFESPALSCLYSMALLRNQIRPDNKWICEGGQADSTGVP